MPVLSDVFNMLMQGINACFGWFSDLFTGEWSLLVYGIIFFFLFSRLIINPLFGSRSRGSGSDSVKEIDEE